MTCWSCQGEAPRGAPFCPSCAKIQPVPRSEDHFTLLGLPREFALDPSELERRFRDLSRRLHPDRFARSSPRERRFSLDWATRINDAARCLRDWRLRAAYLLRLAGTDVLAEGRTFADPEFLEEQLEWREAMALARADGDAARLAEIATRARARLADLAGDVTRLFGDEEWSSELTVDIALRLARARYYDNVVADAERVAP